jgi:hypothetical protein
LSDGIIQEGPQRISEAAIQISRCRVADFLNGQTGYDLLPDSGKVWKMSSSCMNFSALMVILITLYLQFRSLL